MQHVAAPALAQTVDLGGLVDSSGRDDQPATGDARPVVEEHLEAAVLTGRRDGATGAHLPGVLLERGDAGGVEVARRDALEAQVVVHPRGGGVAGLAGVDDEHGASRAGQGDAGAEAGGTAADDEHVVVVGHGSSSVVDVTEAPRRRRN